MVVIFNITHVICVFLAHSHTRRRTQIPVRGRSPVPKMGTVVIYRERYVIYVCGVNISLWYNYSHRPIRFESLSLSVYVNKPFIAETLYGGSHFQRTKTIKKRLEAVAGASNNETV